VKPPGWVAGRRYPAILRIHGGPVSQYANSFNTDWQVFAAASYGTDMYVREYEAELGLPWENLDAYLKVSRPFLEAGNITTPTLFLCGELVIYPDQYHGLDVPSYLVDRMQRYLDWYSKYL